MQDGWRTFGSDTPAGTSHQFGTGWRRRCGVTWNEWGSGQASAGKGGVGNGSIKGWGCTEITAFGTWEPGRKRFQHDRTHKPWCEVSRRARCLNWARRVRGGEGWKRSREATAPLLDPTDEGAMEKVPRYTSEHGSASCLQRQIGPKCSAPVSHGNSPLPYSTVKMLRSGVDRCD